MRDRRPDLYIPLMVIAIIVLLALLSWVNARVLGQGLGTSEFLTGWQAARMVINDDLSPYGPVAVARIRQIDSQLPEFRYPLFSVLVFAPFTLTADAHTAQAVWLSVLEIGVLFIVLALALLLQWRPRGWIFALYLAFALGWVYTVQPVLAGSPALLAAVFLFAGLVLAIYENLELAGFLLALSTFAGGTGILVLAFILIWLYATERVRAVTIFVISLLVFLIGANLAQNGWLIEYLRVMAGETGARFMTSNPYFSWPLAVALALVLIREWVIALRKEPRWMLWTAGLSLAATPFLGIPVRDDQYILFLLPLVIVLVTWQMRWARAGLLLQAIFSLVFLAGSWGLVIYMDAIGTVWVLPALSIILLYWVRWWWLYPKALPIDTIRSLYP